MWQGKKHNVAREKTQRGERKNNVAKKHNVAGEKVAKIQPCKFMKSRKKHLCRGVKARSVISAIV